MVHLTAADYFEQIVADAATTNREFVAFLRSYNAATGAATIASAPRGGAISAQVAPRVRSFPQLMAPNARVLVKKLPNHPLTITDILDLAQTKGAATIFPGPHQFIDEEFRLRVAGFAAGEALSFSARDTNTLPFVLRVDVFALTVDAHGSGELPFIPAQGIVFFAGWQGPITLFVTGSRSGLTATVTFQAFLRPLPF